MFTKQTLLATLVGGLTIYFLGWIFYDLIAGSYFEDNALHEIPERIDMASIALGALIQGFALSNLYRYWHTSRTGRFRGFEMGAWVGLFTGLGSGLIFYGTAAVHTLNTHLVDAAWHIVFYGITGMLIAWSYGLMTTNSKSEN